MFSQKSSTEATRVSFIELLCVFIRPTTEVLLAISSLEKIFHILTDVSAHIPSVTRFNSFANTDHHREKNVQIIKALPREWSTWTIQFEKQTFCLEEWSFTLQKDHANLFTDLFIIHHFKQKETLLEACDNCSFVPFSKCYWLSVVAFCHKWIVWCWHEQLLRMRLSLALGV